jgi:hypothetical protein
MLDSEQYLIVTFIPPECLDRLQAALTHAGAGRVGNYDHCMAVSPVTGYWRPLQGSNPYQGELGKIESAAELKVETSCRREHVAQVIQAIRSVHPYEEPVIQVLPILNQFFASDDGEIRYGP